MADHQPAQFFAEAEGLMMAGWTGIIRPGCNRDGAARELLGNPAAAISI